MRSIRTLIASIESVFDGGSEGAAAVDDSLFPGSHCDDRVFGKNLLDLG
jgi:hypothetical protein